MQIEGNGPWKLYRMTDNQVGLKLGDKYFSFWSPDGSIQILEPMEKEPKESGLDVSQQVTSDE